MSEPEEVCSYDSMTCDSICHWEYLLNDHMEMSLQETNFDNGVITVMIGCWLNYILIMSEKLSREKGYRNLINYTMATTLRRAIPIIILTPPFRTLMNDWFDQSLLACKIFGFSDSLFAVYELESLTQVCIERFINALYSYKGWRIPDWHNKLFISISLLLALLYSSLPLLLDYVIYELDFDCANCTFIFLLSKEGVYKVLVIATFFLKSLKPIVVMIVSLAITRWIELTKIKKHDNSVDFTASICTVVVSNTIFWFPIFVVRFTVMITHLVQDHSELYWSPCFLDWAITMHWIAPSFTMISFIWYNRRVRAMLFNLISLRPIDSDEPTPPPTPDRASPSENQPPQENKAQEAEAQEANAEDTN